MGTIRETGGISPTSLAANFASFSLHRLSLSAANIQKCLERLDDHQLWYRHGDWENSVGNLTMHLEGNLRQFVLHAVAHKPVVRNREREFSLSFRISRKELVHLFRLVLSEVEVVLSPLTEEDLLTVTDPHTAGWSAMTKLEAIYHAVGHFQLHAGQIIFLTKQLTMTDLDLSIPRVR